MLSPTTRSTRFSGTGPIWPVLRSRALGGSNPESGEQLAALPARRDDALRLDMAVAADLFGQRSDLHGSRVVLRRQPLQQLLHRLLVLADQRALGAPLRGVTEHIEGSAAQAFQAF